MTSTLFLWSFYATISGNHAGRTFSLSVSEIYYIEAVERKTFLYTKDEVYLAGKKLYDLETYLKSIKNRIKKEGER